MKERKKKKNNGRKRKRKRETEKKVGEKDRMLKMERNKKHKWKLRRK